MVLETCVETCVSLIAWLRRRRSSTSTLTVSSNILRSTFDNDASLEKRLNISSGTMWHMQDIEYSPLDSHPDTGHKPKSQNKHIPPGLTHQSYLSLCWVSGRCSATIRMTATR